MHRQSAGPPSNWRWDEILGHRGAPTDNARLTLAGQSIVSTSAGASAGMMQDDSTATTRTARDREGGKGDVMTIMEAGLCVGVSAPWGECERQSRPLKRPSLERDKRRLDCNKIRLARGKRLSRFSGREVDAPVQSKPRREVRASVKDSEIPSGIQGFKGSEDSEKPMNQSSVISSTTRMGCGTAS